MFWEAALRRSYFAQVVVLLATAAYNQASGLAQLASSVLVAREFDAASPTRDDAAVAPSLREKSDRGPRDHATSADWIIFRNPFDSQAPRPLVAPAVDRSGQDGDNPVCSGGRAVIVVAASEANWSTAALAMEGLQTRFVRRGDDIGDGRRVEEIEWNRVVLSRGSQRCQLQMFQSNPSRATISAPSQSGSLGTLDPLRESTPLPADIVSRIRKIGSDEFHVDRAAVDRILENHMDLVKGVRIVPEQENGRSAGVRLLGIRPGSLLAMLGIENGDSLRSINGFDLSSPENALQAYARVRSSEHLLIETSRGKQKRNIDLEIK